ncbi:hypothetical protein BH11BAC2_BH11BAC2_21010 [soil metagenome]
MLRVLEISWLIIALLGGTFGGYKWATECFSSALGFFIFTVVAIIFWMVRRKQRIQMDKNESAS